jgi:hypothetical protein
MSAENTPPVALDTVAAPALEPVNVDMSVSRTPLPLRPPRLSVVKADAVKDKDATAAPEPKSSPRRPFSDLLKFGGNKKVRALALACPSILTLGQTPAAPSSDKDAVKEIVVDAPAPVVADATVVLPEPVPGAATEDASTPTEVRSLTMMPLHRSASLQTKPASPPKETFFDKVKHALSPRPKKKESKVRLYSCSQHRTDFSTERRGRARHYCRGCSPGDRRLGRPCCR